VEQAAQDKPKASPKKAEDVPPLPTLSIQRSAQSLSNDTALTNVLPEVGAVVLARVTRINPRQATVAILVVGETVCSDEFQGLIR
jgi:exosome complex component CSL4